MYYVAKIIVEENSEQFYQTKWRHHITGDPDCARFRNVYKTILISALWLSASTSEDIQNVHTTLRVLTDNRPTDELPCEYCGRVNSNRQWHILTECYITHNKRANLLVKRTFLGEGVQAIPPLMTFSDVLYSMLCGDRLDGNTDDYELVKEAYKYVRSTLRNYLF